MNRGFLATLFAAVFSFAGVQAAYSAAPVIGNLPNINIGDNEDPISPGGSDSNFFVFTNAFQFSTNVSDADTPVTQLAWSFGEYDGVGSSPANRYQVNGKGPVAAGTTAVGLLDAAGGPLNPGANQLNSGAVGSPGDYASFRDIVFSPANQSGPFPAPSAGAAADAAAGKQVRFYVSDGDTVTSKSIWVTTKDNSFDEASSSAPVNPYVPLYTEASGFGNWVFSGIDDGPESNTMPTSPDSVDVQKDTNKVETIVRASSGRYRIAGWSRPNVTTNVGADKHLRGKFYIYTSNAAGVPVNQVPGFRIRVENGSAVHATLNLIPGMTGNTGPAPPGQNPNFYSITNDPSADAQAGQFLRPSGNPLKPSLYRVDLDPVDVPALAGTGVNVTMESYATPDPAAGTLSLTEVAVGSYPALTDDVSKRIFLYDRTAGTDTAQNVDASSGAFNHDNDFRPGYRQALQVGLGIDSTPSSQLATFTEGASGLTMDTSNGQTDNFTVGLINITGATNATKPRFQAGKLYRARFFATSNLAGWSNNDSTLRQGYIRFRIQTAKGVWNSYQELLGPKAAGDSSPWVAALAQAIPSSGSVNPDQGSSAGLKPSGHGGGWYSVITGSPLDDDIRRDTGTFGTLPSEPGPGSTSDSAKNITLGVDIVQQARNLRLNDTTLTNFPFMSVNRANVTVHRVELYEYNQIDDGGYAY